MTTASDASITKFGVILIRHGSTCSYAELAQADELPIGSEAVISDRADAKAWQQPLI